MTYVIGTITLSTEGTSKQFPVGFQPTRARLTVSGKDDLSGVIQYSEGMVDSGGYQYCHSLYGDSSGFSSERVDDKMIKHKERVNGTISTVLDVDFNSFYSSGIKLDVNTASIDYHPILECWS